MSLFRRWRTIVSVLFLLLSVPRYCQRRRQTPGGQYPAALFSGLHWRDVGPMRGGRSFGVAGSASAAGHVLFRLGGWRRLEDDERGADLVSDLG